ncbi:MAG TPA: hypothetical protein VLM40_17630, partial [Gemmata sp.]|nr:hypothetical protein [Gemmata sp.]
MRSDREWYNDDDEPRVRPSSGKRSRRGREPRGLSGAALAGIIGGGILVAVVLAVFLARKVGSAGLVDGLPIDSEAFNKISRKDRLESLEARYGRPRRLSNAEMETITFTGPHSFDRRLRVRESLKKMIADRRVTNPECYRWQWANATLYVAMKPNDPKQNPLLKIYVRSGPDENGNTHNEMGLS